MIEYNFKKQRDGLLEMIYLHGIMQDTMIGIKFPSDYFKGRMFDLDYLKEKGYIEKSCYDQNGYTYFNISITGVDEAERIREKSLVDGGCINVADNNEMTFQPFDKTKPIIKLSEPIIKYDDTSLEKSLREFSENCRKIFSFKSGKK